MSNFYHVEILIKPNSLIIARSKKLGICSVNKVINTRNFCGKQTPVYFRIYLKNRGFGSSQNLNEVYSQGI